MSAAINTPIAFVMALARSDYATRGCLNAAVVCLSFMLYLMENPKWSHTGDLNAGLQTNFTRSAVALD